jgi:hypothetical protein
MALPVLPTYYYRDHFVEMLNVSWVADFGMGHLSQMEAGKGTCLDALWIK